jgi:hypothetical protein
MFEHAVLKDPTCTLVLFRLCCAVSFPMHELNLEHQPEKSMLGSATFLSPIVAQCLFERFNVRTGNKLILMSILILESKEHVSERRRLSPGLGLHHHGCVEEKHLQVDAGGRHETEQFTVCQSTEPPPP